MPESESVDIFADGIDVLIFRINWQLCSSQIS